MGVRVEAGSGVAGAVGVPVGVGSGVTGATGVFVCVASIPQADRISPSDSTSLSLRKPRRDNDLGVLFDSRTGSFLFIFTQTHFIRIKIGIRFGLSLSEEQDQYRFV
jgi:hypothetical protein